jgi:predicted nucleotidyltransferase
MPVRSSGSRVLKWPDRETVVRAIRSWAPAEAERHPAALRIGYFGSYARGDWGVGSDLDVIVLVKEAERPFHERPLKWETSVLPVPVELLVYTEAEWEEMLRDGRGLAPRIAAETIWIWEVAPK